MKLNLNKRLTRALVIGIIGVLVLSASAFAARGSVTGYGKYKDAMTAVFTDTDNVTVDTTVSLIYDGKIAYEGKSQWKVDGVDYSKYDDQYTAADGEDLSAYHYSAVGDTEIWFYEGEDQYCQYPRDAESIDAPFSLGENGEQILAFGKVLADTVLGDLKHNIVLVDERGGVRSYALEVSADQLPALVSAGLDLIFSTAYAVDGYVIYEDVDVAYGNYYENTKGTPLPENYFDLLYTEGYDELWTEYDEIYSAMDSHYEELRAKYGEDAVLYVLNDGGYQVYANRSEYAMAVEYGTPDITAYLGTDAVLKKASFEFSLDENDRLIYNEFSFLLSVTDSNGEKHTTEWKVVAELSDYGTTRVVAADPGDRTLSVE